MASRKAHPEKTSASEKTPAQRRAEYLRRLTILLSVISFSLIVIFLLLPPSGGVSQSGQIAVDRRAGDSSPRGSGSTQDRSVPDFEPEYRDAPDSPGSMGSRSDEGQAGTPAENGSQEGPDSAGMTEKDPETGDRGAAAGRRPSLVLVIDDVGYNLDGLKPFLDIPVPITFAVLPQLDYSKESARLIAEAGQEIILHLPLESQSGQNPGPGTLRSDMSNRDLRRELERNVDSVPGLVGMNNHMGSRGTEDVRIVREVLQFASERSMLFLDSRTTAQSVVPLMAEAVEIPFIERDVFLDNQKEKAYIMDAIEQGKAVARQKGHAVLIGHVWTEELAEVLLENYDFILDEGYDFATLSTVIFKGE